MPNRFKTVVAFSRDERGRIVKTKRQVELADAEQRSREAEEAAIAFSKADLRIWRDRQMADDKITVQEANMRVRAFLALKLDNGRIKIRDAETASEIKRYVKVELSERGVRWKDLSDQQKRSVLVAAGKTWAADEAALRGD